MSYTNHTVQNAKAATTVMAIGATKTSSLSKLELSNVTKLPKVYVPKSRAEDKI
jgi:hypothetical protein